jgi:hypothetical protein
MSRRPRRNHTPAFKAKVALAAVIPSPGDQNLWAQSLRPMDMISQGRSVSLFHASQQ